MKKLELELVHFMPLIPSGTSRFTEPWTEFLSLASSLSSPLLEP